MIFVGISFASRIVAMMLCIGSAMFCMAFAKEPVVPLPSNFIATGSRKDLEHLRPATSEQINCDLCPLSIVGYLIQCRSNREQLFIGAHIGERLRV